MQPASGSFGGTHCFARGGDTHSINIIASPSPQHSAARPRPRATAAVRPPSAAPAAAPEEDEPAAPAAAEKTLFTIKLESFEATAKPKIIKEIKGMLGLSLVDSKKFVESAPKVLKEGITKEDAEKIKTTLEGLGGKVSMD